MKNKTCLIIVGQTAVGKTNFAVQLAQHFKTQIISADSRQCFRELNIGVAKPSAEHLQKVKHWFINSHSVKEDVNAKVFEEYSLRKVSEIFAIHDKAIMVGGTGLYIKAFCEGLDEMPSIKTEIRNSIITNYNNGGVEWLNDQIQKNDPAYFIKGEIKNPQRMIRALEVKMSTGRSILDFQLFKKRKRDFKIIRIGLELPREQLYQNINKRVDDMISSGLLNEVESLLPFKNLNALQTVGYKELFEYLDKKISLDEAVEKIKINTRHYAKRQLTWFKKDKEIKWYSPFDKLPALLNNSGC